MCPLNMEPIGNPEKSVLNHPTLHNIPEDDRIQVNHSEGLRSCKLSIILIVNKSQCKSRMEVMEFHIAG